MEGLMILFYITTLVLPGMYFYFIIAILIISTRRKFTQSKPNVMTPSTQIYYPYKKSKAIKVMVIIMLFSFLCIIIPEIILMGVYAETGEMLWWAAAIAEVFGIGVTILVGKTSFKHKVESIELTAVCLTVKYRNGQREDYLIADYESYTTDASRRGNTMLQFRSANGERFLYLNMLTPNATDMLVRSVAFAHKNKRLPVVEVLPTDTTTGRGGKIAMPAFVNLPTPPSAAAPVPSASAKADSSPVEALSSAAPGRVPSPAAQADLLKTNQELAEIEADPVKYDQYLKSFIALLTLQARSRISTLCAQDQKMQAIKECREITGAGLKYAKESVERYLAVPGLQYYTKRIYLQNVKVPTVEAAVDEYCEIYPDEFPFILEYGEAAGTTWVYVIFRAKPKEDDNILWWHYLNVLLWLTEKTHTLFAFAQPAVQNDPLTRVAADSSLSAANGINLRGTPHPERSSIFLEPEFDNAYGDSVKGIIHGFRFRFIVSENKFEWISEVAPDFDYVRHIRDLFSFDPTDIREKPYTAEEKKAEPEREEEDESFTASVSYKSYVEKASSAFYNGPANLTSFSSAAADPTVSSTAPAAEPAATGKWHFVTSGVEGNADVFGVNIFDYKWESTGQTVEVEDPSFNQKYRFPVYRVEIKGKVHEFAAGEFSPLVYGFFTRE